MPAAAVHGLPAAGLPKVVPDPAMEWYVHEYARRCATSNQARRAFHATPCGSEDFGHALRALEAAEHQVDATARALASALAERLGIPLPQLDLAELERLRIESQAVHDAGELLDDLAVA